MAHENSSDWWCTFGAINKTKHFRAHGWIYFVPFLILKISSPGNLKHNCKLSRRELAISGNSSLLLLLGTQILEPFNLSKVRAEEENLNDTSLDCTNKVPTKKAFLDVSIDGQPVGRIVVGLYGETAPAGAARFSSLVSGTAGISYRRKEFVKIMPNYVQHGGKNGRETMSKCSGTKNLAGTVSIIVRDPSKPPPKLKLVARKGKLEIDQEEVGKDPNGTEFVISTKDSPELDASALVVGKGLGRNGGRGEDRTAVDFAIIKQNNNHLLFVEQGGKANRRQKGCCGRKRLQPPLLKGGHHKLWLDGITTICNSCSFSFVL
ncbi:hypothetical protein Patl1_19038 [Pistacia atlantica]|uniref:Uncharacterized protein n=1 Tax=Pistacia atlantica TaxID=434234 RepID=A0ACC1BYV5_9ROSI|nr:hypothetical protein Patl1_19038 [Pistacia atlantica]